MKATKFNHRGSEFNKIQFCEIEDYLTQKGLNVDAIFQMIADENEFIYVSNGFVSGLLNDNEDGEWHHFFKKDTDGNFIAGKLRFDI